MNLTIAIPSYNRPQLLARTLSTIQALPWRSPPHVLVCVNHPQDGYREVIERFSQSRYFRFLEQKSHVSSGQQLFAALSLAETEFVLGLADDDELDASVVEQYMDLMNEYGEIAAVYAPIKYVNHATHQEFIYNGVPPEGKVVSRGDYVDLISFLANNQHWPELGIYRTKALQGILHNSNWSFYELNKLAGLLENGHVAFAATPFYHFVLQHVGESSRANLGTSLVMQPDYIEQARGGLERIAERAMQQLGNGIEQAQFEYIRNASAVLISTRLRESYYACVNAGRYADALDIGLRLRTYLIDLDPPPESFIVQASIEAALRILAARSWKASLVLYKLDKLGNAAGDQAGLVRCSSVDRCRELAASSIFLTGEASLPELLDVAPAADCLSIESVARSLVPRLSGILA